MAIHGGIPFGSAGGAALELREERLQRHLWADGMFETHVVPASTPAKFKFP